MIHVVWRSRFFPLSLVILVNWHLSHDISHLTSSFWMDHHYLSSLSVLLAFNRSPACLLSTLPMLPLGSTWGFPMQLSMSIMESIKDLLIMPMTRSQCLWSLEMVLVWKNYSQWTRVKVSLPITWRWSTSLTSPWSLATNWWPRWILQRCHLGPVDSSN